MKRKLIILSSVILLSISISAGWVSKPISNNADGCIVAMEQENGLELESWMIDEKTWSTFDYNLSIIDEESLQIEPWMVSDVIWN